MMTVNVFCSCKSLGGQDLPLNVSCHHLPGFTISEVFTFTSYAQALPAPLLQLKVQALEAAVS